MFRSILHVYAALLNEAMYLRLAKDFSVLHAPELSVEQLRELEPAEKRWMNAIRKDLLSAFCWTVAAALCALLFAMCGSRVSIELPVAPQKLLATIGPMLVAWPTWFGLANLEDTWDMDTRLDLHVRRSIFKVLFFPGLVMSLIGTVW